MKADMMKTTIEIDEAKLERIMTMGGFSTRKEAVDWALTEAERIASLDRIAENPWPSSVVRDAVDASYDVAASRKSIRYSAPRSRRK